MPTPTHYDVLGLPRGSSPESVRSAYRKLVLLHHPDRSSDPGSAEIFLRATEAYSVLSEPLSRMRYDDQLELADQREKVARDSRRQAAERAVPRTKPAPQRSIPAEVTRISLYFSRGQYAEAEKLAKRVLKEDARQPIPYAVLGDLARARGDVNEAQKMYAFAAQMDPGNGIYQQRYEQLLESSAVRTSNNRVVLDARSPGVLLPAVAALVALLAAVYIALGSEPAVFGAIPIISSWTLGLLVVLCLCGMTLGACLSIGNLVDRFHATASTATGRFGPTVTLGSIAIVNFWVAALVYGLIGATQRGFNYSTSRVVIAVGLMTGLFSLAAAISGRLSSLEVFLWGGNVLYVAALVGWMVADAFRSG